MKTIGQNIRTARQSAHLSQIALAKKTKLTQGHISFYESDMAEPRTGTLKRIARALGVSVGNLIGEG